LIEEILSRALLGLLNGVAWGLIIALIALGLSLILGIMEIVNFAHGELFMIGGVITVYMVVFSGLSFWLACIVAPLLVAALGMGLERGVLRPVEGAPVRTVIATLGLSFILMQVVLLTYGGAAYNVPGPVTGVFKLPLVVYSKYRLIAAIMSIACLTFVLGILYKTKLGLWIRAAQQHFEMAQALGINVKYVNTIAFGLGSGVAAFAGVIASPIMAMEWIIGIDALLLAFIVVLVGGLGSIKGTFVAGIIIGIVESTAGIFLSPTFARAISLSILIGILVFRPRGLFGVW